MPNTTYIIAEAGSCHDGDFHIATDLTALARDCGAQAIKWQYWSDHNRLADRRRVPQVYRDFYRHYAVPLRWLPELYDIAEAAGLDFMATAFLPEDVAVVAPFVKHFKVASFEASARDLLAAHVEFLKDDIQSGRNRNVIVSRGMGHIVDADIDSGIPWRYYDRLKFLLCTSAYPAPVDQLNLRRLQECEMEAIDGLSDHSDPTLTWTGALAVAAGARIIEAHIRHHRTNLANPDAPHAMSAPQFRDYVRHIRFTEIVLGDGEVKAQPSEGPMMAYRAQSEV